MIGTTWQRRLAPPTPIDGEHYFYPGTTDYAELAQDVDVTAYADKIDLDEQWFRFAGWVHTLYEADPRTARMVVEYRDALPDTFTDDVEVVLEGRMDAAGAFQATTVLTKCGSRYEASPEDLAG